MPLRAVFLDIGSTLLSIEPSRFAIYADAATRRGRAIEPDAMRRAMGRAHHALAAWHEGAFRYSDPWFRHFIERIFGAELGFDAAAVAEITEELFERFEAPEHYRLFPGTRALLRELRERGLVLGVISNWSARLDRVLERLELADAFDFVLASAVEGVEKPDPAIFERALDRAGVAPADALHAGDQPELDTRPARALGMRAVLVDHGASADRPEAPTGDPGEGVPRVSTLAELGAVILGAS